MVYYDRIASYIMAIIIIKCIAIVLKAYSSIKCKCNLKIFHTILTEQRCETQGIMFVFETNYIVYAIW